MMVRSNRTPSPLGERVGVRGVLTSDVEYFLSNGFDHSVRVREHLVVPEAKRTVAIFCDDGAPFLVPCAVGMLSTVQFNGEPKASTREIGNERADWELSDKLGVLELRAAQSPPKTRLGVRSPFAKVSGHRCQSLFRHLPNTLTQPSPSRERAIELHHA